MIKTLSILFFWLFIGVGSAIAQESPDKYGVTFPVADLGNCDSISSCRSFCEDPVNKSSCVSFAKQKGFYKEQGNKKQKEMLEKATSDLGCTSPDACRQFCHQEANFNKCSSFAKKHNFSGGQVDDPSRAEVLQKAKQALGCNSPDSCRSFCQEEGNRQKCSEFAKDSGLRGGEKRVGPGGCSSEETCKSFCSDPANFGTCSSFGGQGGPNGQNGPRGQFKGPGGCNSEEECRSHCEQNPQECKIISTSFDGTGPIDNPEQAAEQFKKFCEGNPDKCQGGGNFSPFSKEGRGKFEEFCKENPEKCRGGGDKFIRIEPRVDREQFCKENPDKCQRNSGGRFEGGKPEKLCDKNPDECKKLQGQGKVEFEGRSNEYRDVRYQGPPGELKPQDKPLVPEGYRPPDGLRPGGPFLEGGFKPQEDGNHPREGQKAPESFSPPGNGGNTTGSSDPGGTVSPPGGLSPAGN